MRRDCTRIGDKQKTDRREHGIRQIARNARKIERAERTHAVIGERSVVAGQRQHARKNEGVEQKASQNGQTGQTAPRKNMAGTIAIQRLPRQREDHERCRTGQVALI